ncbi:PGF-pre-PGF domain-containing protein [Methanosarcina barkeri]|uniref:Cell surface protein n=1 Tax=Methanosarcina barkeri 227 TaxID=1434106 RepID=A0A0E3R3A5_METBA|nr:PGF-pre-PGF domain-containing protein [Methanosarcina barkeri]AKB58155.1 Cell surface protein [Methanosarcina barkeri 227]
MNLIKAFRNKSLIQLSGLISGFVLIILFAWIILPASAAGIEVNREISAGTVNPGESFAVTVHIITEQDIEALTLDENLPEGWQVSQWENNGAVFQKTSTFKASTLEWIWVENFSAGEEKTVVYNVTVPSNFEPGNFTLSGRISAYSVSATPVEGFSEIVVISPPEANFSAIPLLGPAPLIVQFTDLSTFNPDSWEWDFDGNGNIDSNERNPVYTYESPGVYTVILKATNSTYGNSTYGNSTRTKVGYITVTEKSSGSGENVGNEESSGGNRGGNSGGGGGGAGSPESTGNVDLKEISNEQVFKGIHTCFTFKGEANEIVTVEFDPKKNFGKTTAIVEILKNTSSIVKEPAPGTVYRNVNIWIGNNGFSSQENFENASINFRVSRAWITEQGGSKDTVALYRYSEEVWNSLPTTFSREDEVYFYFTAETPGFSPFAISSMKINTKSIEFLQTKNEENKGNNKSNLSEGKKQENITNVNLELNKENDEEKRDVPNPAVFLTVIGFLTSYVILSKRKHR